MHTYICSAAQAKLASQPKSAALSSEGTVFVAEGTTIEAFRSNQRVAELAVKYEAHGIASAGSVVAVGGDVSLAYMLTCMLPDTHHTILFRITKYIYMHGTGKN